MDLEDFLEQASSEREPEPQKKGARPDYSVVQPQRQQDGKEKLVSVGGMWKNVSKQGREFYTLKIGNLRLLVFPNDKQTPTPD